MDERANSKLKAVRCLLDYYFRKEHDRSSSLRTQLEQTEKSQSCQQLNIRLQCHAELPACSKTNIFVGNFPEKISTMMYKYFFLALIGLNLWPSLITAEPHRVRLHLHHSRKLSSISLIENACRGVGVFQSKCLSTLQSSPAHQKADANGLAFFTLRFVENNAANLSDAIKAYANDPNLPPLLQSALTDCMEQYIPLDDIVEDAINAVLANAYPDAQQFIQAAITNLDECDTELKRDYLQEKTEENSAEDFKVAKDLKDTNIFLRSMLSAALNIVSAN